MRDPDLVSDEVPEAPAPKRPGCFRKGQSGNPGGRPAGIERVVREIVGANVEALVRAQIKIAKGIAPDEAPHMVVKPTDCTRAFEALMDRGWGKPKQPIDLREMPSGEADLSSLSMHELEDLIREADDADADAASADPG